DYVEFLGTLKRGEIVKRKMEYGNKLWQKYPLLRDHSPLAITKHIEYLYNIAIGDDNPGVDKDKYYFNCLHNFIPYTSENDESLEKMPESEVTDKESVVNSHVESDEEKK